MNLWHGDRLTKQLELRYEEPIGIVTLMKTTITAVYVRRETGGRNLNKFNSRKSDM